MKRFLIHCLLAAALPFISGCVKEEAYEIPRPEPCTVGLVFERQLPEEVVTKSVITAADFESKFTSITYAVYSGGSLFQTKYYFNPSGGLDMEETYVELEKGFTFTVYAFVNMGDMRVFVPADESSIGSVQYAISSYTGMSVSAVNNAGIPMAGSATFKPESDSESRTIPLRRLLAKVTATLSCDWDGAVIESAKVYQMNAVLRPFGTSAAGTAADLLPFQEEHTGAGTSSLVATFYVPENMQGTVSGVSVSSNKSADNPLVAAVKNKATYLETVVSSTGRYEGTVKYRTYLGGNATSSFDVRGNYHYSWTINFHSTKVDDYDNDWKHDFNDGLTIREYEISLSPDPGAVDVGSTLTEVVSLKTKTLKPVPGSYTNVLSGASCDEWLSSDPTVATVSNGVVSGLKAGSTVITAKYTPPGYDFSQLSASATVNVGDVVTYSFFITPATSAGNTVGSSVALTAKYITTTNGVPDEGTVPATGVSWTSSNAKFSVSPASGGGSAIVTASAGEGGTTTITATYTTPDAVERTATATVGYNDVVSKYLEVTATPAATSVGNTIQMGAKLHTVTNGVDDGGVAVPASDVTWTKTAESGGTDYVSVNASGVVSDNTLYDGVKTATIKGGYNTYEGTADVSFSHTAVITHSLTVSGPASANVGETIALTATYKTFTDGVETASETVTTSAAWSRLSGNAGISVGAATGVVSATNASHLISAFSAVIKASYLGEEGTMEVTFNPVVTHWLAVAATPSTQSVGGTIQMSAKYYTRIDGYDSSVDIGASNVIWSRKSGSSNVSVDSYGVVGATAGGTAVIRGKYTSAGEDYYGEASVTFTDVVTHSLEVSSNNGYSTTLSGRLYLIATYYTFTNGVQTGSQVVSVASGTSWLKESGSSAAVSVTKGATYGEVSASGSAAVSAKVYATYAGEESNHVTVSFADDIVNELIVSASPASQKKGSTIQMSARLKTTVNGGTPTYNDIPASSVTWTALDAGASGPYTGISVNGSGVVSFSGTATGTAVRTIQGTYESVSGSAGVTFTDNVTHTLILSTSDANGRYNKPVTYTATYKTFTNGVQTASQDVTSSAVWAVSQPLSPARYSVSAGVVSADASVGNHSVAGSPTVTATYSGLNASATPVFTDVVSKSLSVSATPASQSKGSTIQMGASLTTTTNGYDAVSAVPAGSVTWTALSTGTSGGYTNIVVNASGVVSYSGTSSGTATRDIQGTYDGVSAKCQVTFTDVVTYSFNVSPASSTGNTVGNSVSLTARYVTTTNGVADGGTVPASGVTWTSSNAKFSVSPASGSGSASVTASAGEGGMTTITASYTTPDAVNRSATATVSYNDVVTKYLEVTASPSSTTFGNTIQMSAKLHTVTNGVDDGGVSVPASSVSWSKTAESGGTDYISVSASGVVSCSTNPSGTTSATIGGSYSGATGSATVSFTHTGVVTHSLVISGATSSNVGTPIQLTATYKTFTDGVETGSQNVTTSATWTRRSGSANVTVGSNTGLVSATNPSHTTFAITAVVGATYSGTVSDNYSVTFNPVVTHSLTAAASPATQSVGSTIQMSATYYTYVDGYQTASASVSASSVSWTRDNYGTNYSRISVNASGVVSYSGTASGGASSRIRGTYSGTTSGWVSVSFTDVVTHGLEVTTANVNGRYNLPVTYIATYKTYTNGVVTSTQDVSSSAAWTVSQPLSPSRFSVSAGVVSADASVGNHSVAATVSVSASYAGENASGPSAVFTDVDGSTLSIVRENGSSADGLRIAAGASVNLRARYVRILNGISDSASYVTASATWSSSSTSVFTVGNGSTLGGKLTGVSVGTGTVTVTYSGKSATAGVEVVGWNDDWDDPGEEIVL